MKLRRALSFCFAAALLIGVQGCNIADPEKGAGPVTQPGDGGTDGSGSDGMRDAGPGDWRDFGTRDGSMPDRDGDSVPDATDNCPDVANVEQADSDEDGVGDACEAGAVYDASRDRDEDGFRDVEDNCPEDENPEQGDDDGDSIGNRCDNCPNVANYDQTDSDSDGKGDSCSEEPVGLLCEVTVTEILSDIWLILDQSGSMGMQFSDYLSALDMVLPSVASNHRLGISAFPDGTIECSDVVFLQLGTYSGAELLQSYQGANPAGTSVPNFALSQVRSQNYLQDGSDPFASVREKHVILTMDGQNQCLQADGIQAVTDLEADGTEVEVIAMWYSTDPSYPQDLASAANTTLREANSTQQLATELTAAISAARSCQFDVTPAPEDPNKFWVTVDNRALTRNDSDGFTFDAQSRLLTLQGAACSDFRNGAGLDVSAGCLTSCEPSEEVCDYVDNDCDMTVDEGCADCAPEICNGRDDDCDGETDEGCPV